MSPVENFDDQVDQLVPLDDEAPTDDELEADLDEDTFPPAEPLIVEEVEDAAIGRSWAFDFVRGRFLPGPGGGPLATQGHTTLRYWVEKALRTPRGTYPIYAEEYGLEGVDDLIGAPLDTDAVHELGSRIFDTLTFHPRITDVTDFQSAFDESDETLFISFRVVTDEEEEIDIQNFALR